MLDRYLGIFFSFSAIQAMQLAIPLLALPWLGRVLGSDAFGLLMYISLVPQFVALIMDWGLVAGGAKLAALSRNDQNSFSNLLGSVYSAKTVLATFCLSCAILSFPVLPHAKLWPFAFFTAVLEGICRGMSPLWFFQGIGKGMQKMAVWDTASSLCALALVFMCIKSPDNWQLYFFLTALCKGIAYSCLIFNIWRCNRFRMNFRSGLSMLKQTRELFGVSFANAIQTYGTQIILGFFLPAAQMGILVACGKMVRAMFRVIVPAGQTLFPEICVMRAKCPQKTRTILRITLFASFSLMLLCSIIVYLLAPKILQVALGPGYESGAIVLKIMIFAAPLMGCNHILGLQTLVPFGHEKAQMRVQCITAFLALPLSAIVGHAGGIMAAACLPLALEAFLCLGLALSVFRYCPQALLDTGEHSGKINKKYS